jgi:hypothetical protein
VALCDLILKHSSASILCVCYTNHALDQFLEALLDKGITDIVRIGSRSKSKRLEQYNLRDLDQKSRGSTLTLSESRRLSLVHRELELVQGRIRELADLLAGSQGRPAAVSQGQGGAGSSGPSAAAAACPSRQQGSNQGGSNGSSAGGGWGAARTPAEASAAANAAWQERNRKLLEDEEKSRQARMNKARQQGRSWAQEEQEQAGNSGRHSGYWEWPDGIQPYLDAEHPEVLDQLQQPAEMTKISRDYLWRRWLSGSFDKGAVDRWQQAKQQSRPPPPKGAAATAATAAGRDSSWTEVKAGQGNKQQQTARPPVPEPLAAAAAGLARGVAPDWEALLAGPLLPKHLWALPWALRQDLAMYWRGQLQQGWAEELQALLQDQASKLQQELSSLRTSGYEAILQKARVIGCTTTGAALQKQLLTSRSVSPE